MCDTSERPHASAKERKSETISFESGAKGANLDTEWSGRKGIKVQLIVQTNERKKSIRESINVPNFHLSPEVHSHESALSVGFVMR